MNTLSERASRSIWRPFTQSKIAKPPVAITHARGCYLYTEQNQKLFDGISSWWTNAHGHCHPHIAEAIARQAATLEQVIFADFTHEPAVTLAERLLSHVPVGLQKVFFADNGSTAVETAIKMAHQYFYNRGEERPYFLSLEHGYHGDTFGAMSASERSTFTKPFWPLLFTVLKTKSTCVSEITKDRSEHAITEQALSTLDDLLRAHKNQVAGIIVEPMLQAASGMHIFTQGFLSGIRSLCFEHGILMIADEVATGFYRTGRMFACEHEEVSPDIMCLSKALTGGFLPLSATLASQPIYEAFLSEHKHRAFLHGHSFAGNPMGCAAALASLDLFEQPKTLQRISEICEAIKALMPIFSDVPAIFNARSIGSVAILEFVSDSGYLSRICDEVVQDCLKRGLYLRPLGNVLYFMPPLSATKEEIIWALSTINDAIRRHF